MGAVRDVLVVGAGFGGMAAAVQLARAGHDVVLHEALAYPGGCAATFHKQGYDFEAGATLFSGFEAGQLFDRWRRELDLPVEVELLDRPLELRTAGLTLPVSRDRAELRARLASLSGVPRAGLDRFFDRQQRVAEVLWPLFDDPGRLPPFSSAGLWHHLGQLPRYLGLLPLLRRSLGHVLRRDGLGGCAPVQLFAAAMCQITIQAPPDEAEAVFALGAMDYPHRGAAHVRGGIGRLGRALCEAVERQGGEVRLGDRVRSLTWDGRLWTAQTRSGAVQARRVVANLLPSALQALLPAAHSAVAPRLQRGVATGWGAVMAYLVLRDHEGLAAGPHHLQLVEDPHAPLVEGNHLLCSVSPRGQGEERTATVSTHLDLGALLALSPGERAARVEHVQARLAATLARHAPEVASHVVVRFPGSPRTFERFTRRPEGFVGGVPRRVGLHHLLDLWPSRVGPGLWLVGDTTFPGQSTLATAVGGARTARAVGASLG